MIAAAHSGRLSSPEQALGMSQSPRHLLPLHETLADHLVDRRFDEARGDRLAMTVAVPVVHDKALVVLEGTDELPQFSQQLGFLSCHPWQVPRLSSRRSAG